MAHVDYDSGKYKRDVYGNLYPIITKKQKKQESVKQICHIESTKSSDLEG